MPRRRGVFIVLEGPDRSGKSTQAGLLKADLERRGLSVLHTREPGGTSFAEEVRRILLDPIHRVHPLAELLLYEAARAQHTQEILLPSLGQGILVLCERYTLATLAYQGYARGLPIPLVRELNRIASSGVAPDLTLVLDIPEPEFERRDGVLHRDRLEQESSSFRSKVRQAYHKLGRREPRTVLVDACASVQEVQQKILRHVNPILPEPALQRSPRSQRTPMAPHRTRPRATGRSGTH